MSDNINWYLHSKYLPDEIKKLHEAEAAYALREAWFRIYNQYPTERSLAVLWAKSALETDRWKSIHCYNFGNIKRKTNDDNFFTMFECGEEVSLEQATKLASKDPDTIKIVRRYVLANGNQRCSINVKPGHIWSQFRAYKTIEDGAADYIRFVSQNPRYKKAWEKVIEGDPAGYSHELGVAGYYTAPEVAYTAGVVRLFTEFMRRKEELMSWKHDTDPAPPPDPSVIPAPIETEDVHDTDKDVKPPEYVPDINISFEKPAQKNVISKNESLLDGNVAVLIIIMFGAIGLAIVNFFQSCSFF